jgi:hypothetical protein
MSRPVKIARFRAGSELAEIGFDGPPDALVEPVADQQGERRERERVEHDEADDEREPEADAQQVAPALIPGVGEPGEVDRDGVEVHGQQHDENDQDREHDRRRDEAECHRPRPPPPEAETAQQRRDADEEFGDRIRPAAHAPRLAVAALTVRLGR